MTARADSSLFYEDLTYGRRFEAGPRAIGEQDLLDFARLSGDLNPLHVDSEYAAQTRFGRRVVHGPFGIAVAMGLLHDLGILERSVVALLDVDWRFAAPMFVGDSLSLEMTVTSRRLSGSGATGVVGRHMLLRNQRGDVVQEGTMGLLVRVADEERARREDEEHPAPGTLPWGRRLAEALDEDSRFRSSCRAFDGVVSLVFGSSEVAFKIFDGRVLSVARRLPSGSTFAVGAAEITWLDLLRRERNEYVAMATRGAFQVSGNVQEYLRLTKTFMAMLDQARRIS